MKKKLSLLVLASILLISACKKSEDGRLTRLKAISAELRGMKPEEVEGLLQKTTGGPNISQSEAKGIDVVLPGGTRTTLEEVRIALMLEAIGSNNPNAGAWEDDPKNWYRAFHEELPETVAIVRSHYWESNHFTREYLYYFVVRASPEWRDAFLKKRGLQLVKPSDAWSYRSVRGNEIPTWFAPDPVEKYDTWDLPGYHGSVFIDRVTGDIHFEGGQL